MTDVWYVVSIHVCCSCPHPCSLQYVHRCGRAGRDKSSSATVYSFFTRDFAPMAKHVVALLESSGAHIDPNLLELVGTEDVARKKQRRQSNKKRDSTADEKSKDEAKETEPSSDDDWDDGQFANLSANRIVLQRASHVSEASEPESDE